MCRDLGVFGGGSLKRKPKEIDRTACTSYNIINTNSVETNIIGRRTKVEVLRRSRRKGNAYKALDENDAGGCTYVLIGNVDVALDWWVSYAGLDCLY